MHVQVGQILDGKYAIDRLIGQGGMGAVYEARNLRINRRVAIKVLYGSAAENPEAIARFEREAQAAGRIGCDHIVEILDLGVLSDGGRFIAMEYLEGEPLSARIARAGRLTPDEARNVVLQLLFGIAAAHRAGIVHRDLKPDNVFIVREKAGRPDFVKIIDFGISKFQVPGTDVRMTQTGVVMGTPLYMSPEQVRGEATDARTDIYSTGVILYEALTGQRPFAAANYNELILKIALSRCPPASSLVPDLPPDLCAVLEKSLARDREDRFQTAEQFTEALQGNAFPQAAGGTVAFAGRTVAVSSVPPWEQREVGGSAGSWSHTGKPGKATARGSRRFLWLGLVVVPSLVGLAAWLSSRRGDEGAMGTTGLAASNAAVTAVERRDPPPAAQPAIAPSAEWRPHVVPPVAEPAMAAPPVEPATQEADAPPAPSKVVLSPPTRAPAAVPKKTRAPSGPKPASSSPPTTNDEPLDLGY
jgi:serine/threonine-protein kinase